MSSNPCDNCRRSKKKCDRNNPCSRCTSQGVECIYNKINNFKRGAVTKYSSLINRADSLKILLERLVKENIKICPSDIGKLLEHWQGLKRQVDIIKDVELPIVLAWSQIEESLPNVICKTSSLVKTPNMYEEYKLLLDLYVNYLHPVYPFIDPKRLYELLELKQFTNSLITSTLCRAQVLWFAINYENIPKLEELESYRLSIASSIKHQSRASLEQIQTYINLVILEIQQTVPSAASKHLTQAIYMGHQLDLQNALPSIIDPESEEKACCWSLLSYLDFLCFFFLRQPRLIRKEFDLDIKPSIDTSESPNMIYLGVNYELMRYYDCCVQLNWDFAKLKPYFKPTDNSTEEHVFQLKELLPRCQIFLKLLIGEDSLITVNTHSASAKLGYLHIYTKISMLIIDICELLVRHYEKKGETGECYLKLQREHSLRLIELLFPNLKNPSAKSIPNFEFIDPIFPQGAYHSCKILLNRKLVLNRSYFGSSYKFCIKSTKLFLCNNNMIKYFQTYKEHPYIIRWNKELEKEFGTWYVKRVFTEFDHCNCKNI